MTHRGIFRGTDPSFRPIDQPIIVPGSGDDNFRPMFVVQPFVDPPNSFRARTVSDMFFITPDRTAFSTLEFDVGLDPKIKPIMVSIQNRCLNTTLRVNLTLPPFLRSNLGSEFLVPEIGDTTTPPIFYFDRVSTLGPLIGDVDLESVRTGLSKELNNLRNLINQVNRLPEEGEKRRAFSPRGTPITTGEPIVSFLVGDLSEAALVELRQLAAIANPDAPQPQPVSAVTPLPSGAGKGLINVTLTFSEAQAKTLNPDTYLSKIIFDIFPNDELTGPVFVSTTVGKPIDLNESEEEFSIDDNVPIVTGSVGPELLVITQSIEVDKLIPVLGLSFIPGADGVTDAGVTFSAGSAPIKGPPPTGWVTQADGRAYPPIIPDIVCDPVTGVGPAGIALADIPEAELTPLQKLLLSVTDRPLTFGSITKRRGFVIEPRPFLRGHDGNIATAIRLSPQVVVADSIPGRADFKIIASSPIFRDRFTTQVSKELNLVIGARKEGNNLGFPLGGGEFRRLFFETLALRKIIEDGERFEIKANTNTAEELQLARVISPAASILFQLKNAGAG